MKKCLLLIIGCLIVLLPFSAHAFKMKKGQDCMDCHKLKKAEAQNIIERVVPGGKVLDIKSSQLKGVWQIEVQKDAKHGAVLLDFSKKYLVGFQPVPQKVAFSKISLKDSILLGSAGAKKKVIVFTDPDCPYCRELHNIMKKIIEKRKDIAFSLLLIPLPMHKDAPKKVQAILCSKSIEMLDDAFAGKALPDPACPPDAMERNKALAGSLGFTGTPMLVRKDGTVLSGYLPEEKLINWIDKK